MLLKDKDTIITGTRNRNIEAYPDYRLLGRCGFKDTGIRLAEMPGEPPFREMLPEWSPWREHLVLPSTTGLEHIPFEDRVRFLYSINSFLGASFRPTEQAGPIKTYVHSALDNPTIGTRSWSNYEHDALLRAQQLFLEPERFSPEAFAELRRVADRTFFVQKYRDYDFFMWSAGLEAQLETTGWLENDWEYTVNGAQLKWLGEQGRGFEMMRRALRSTALKDSVTFWLIDLISSLSDYIFISFWYGRFRNSFWSPLSLAYYPPTQIMPNQIATAGGCGMSSSLDPMREDPGNYVLDLDIHLTVLAKVSDYGTALNLAYFAGTLPALSEWWYSGSILVDKTALSTTVAVLFILLFALCAVVVLPSSTIRTPVQYAAAFELIGLCVAVLFALVGLLWYDPVGQIIALLSVVVSSCEFIILLSQGIGAVRRPGRPLLSVVVLWGFDFDAIESAFGGVTLSSVWCGLVGAVAGAPSYVVYAAGMCVPTIVAFGVPAVGSVLFLTVMWNNYHYATTVRSTFPLYGERYEYMPWPLSNAGSDKVHGHVEAMLRNRHLFGHAVGDVDAIAQSAALITKYNSIPVTGTDTAAPYGTFIPVILGALVFMLVVFVLLLVVFSSKTRWVDFKDAATQYECGSEQLAVRVTPTTTVSFFRLLLVFWIFELEVAVWLLVFPLITLLSFYSVVAVTIFIFLVQLAALIEIRSGAIRWLRSVSPVCVALTGNQPDGVWFIYTTTFEFKSVFAGLAVFAVCSFACRTRGSAVYTPVSFTAAGAVVCLPILMALSLKQPDVFYFMASDMELDRKLAARVLSVIDSPSWAKWDLGSRKTKIRPLMAGIVAASTAGKVGYWSAYVELMFSAQTTEQLDGIVTLLRYHINANISSLADFKLRIESKTHFCFTVASKSPSTRDSFERCVQASMDIMYDKSVLVAGKPRSNFTGGIPDPLRQAWYRSLDECVGAKPALRACKCRMAAAVRSEFLFFSEASAH